MGSHTLKMQLTSWWTNSTQVLSAWGRIGRPSANYDEVEKFVLFVGYPRSGHTLIGSLLTAHPDVVIAHELDLLKYFARGVRSRATLFELLLNRDRIFTAKGREWTDYNYAVPGQWQGRHRRLRVLGDKKGGESARRLARHPDMLDELQPVVKAPIHVVHVVRNPFDNIATMAWRTRKGIDHETDNYFMMAEACRRTREKLEPECWHHMTHEDFVVRPREALGALCDFLGVADEGGYVDACVGLVRESPNRSRHRVAWTEEQKATVRQRMSGFDFFSGYTFDD